MAALEQGEYGVCLVKVRCTLLRRSVGSRGPHSTLTAPGAHQDGHQEETHLRGGDNQGSYEARSVHYSNDWCMYVV
jgi:hypothetical protein